MRKTVFNIVFIVIVLAVVIFWQFFYWTQCAFTNAADAPVICFAGR